jgi:cytochrome c5
MYACNGFASLCCSVALFAQGASPGSCSNPADVAKMVNPAKPTAESLAQGKKYYGYDGAMCHGSNVWKTGKGHTPRENIRTTPNELWKPVNYIRSLTK